MPHPNNPINVIQKLGNERTLMLQGVVGSRNERIMWAQPLREVLYSCLTSSNH